VTSEGNFSNHPIHVYDSAEVENRRVNEFDTD